MVATALVPVRPDFVWMLFFSVYCVLLYHSMLLLSGSAPQSERAANELPAEAQLAAEDSALSGSDHMERPPTIVNGATRARIRMQKRFKPEWTCKCAFEVRCRTDAYCRRKHGETHRCVLSCCGLSCSEEGLEWSVVLSLPLAHVWLTLTWAVNTFKLLPLYVFLYEYSSFQWYSKFRAPVFLYIFCLYLLSLLQKTISFGAAISKYGRCEDYLCIKQAQLIVLQIF